MVDVLSMVFPFSAIVLVSIFIWSEIKHRLVLNSDLEDLRYRHLKFKRKFTLFDTLLHAHKPLPSSEVIEDEIIFGNKQAPIHLILVSSPFCIHCRDTHHKIENLLTQFGNQLKVSYRINVRPSNRQHTLYELATILIRIYQQKGQEICLQALKYLYTPGAKIKDWISKNMEFHDRNSDHILQAQNAWCESNGIQFTPALFINGRPFPGEYDIEDLKYFIADLEEKFKSENAVEMHTALNY